MNHAASIPLPGVGPFPEEGDAEAPQGVAIIGMSGRFPGSDTPASLWRNICNGVESITHFSEAELQDAFGPDVRGAAGFVRARPILKDVELFDAEFFGMYPREAAVCDPQARVLLECAWQALEDAGYDPAAAKAAIGVFAGSSMNTYFLTHVCADPRAMAEFASNFQVSDYPKLLGASQDFLATRIAYKLDLRGPAMTVQSACSTSLLAVAQACQSLQLYQCDMALAGGASISFPQQRGYVYQEGGMVSPDGSCRSFDADANGTIFGSGAGMVLLKRLEDALADGDHVYAVILGTGVNNDGASKVGYTAPSVSGQAEAIAMAHAASGVDPRSISYIECHGTATPLGDPIEVAGLTQAFRAATDDLQFCALGSVKPNIGHLDAAAGVAGLIKTAMALEQAVLPATLHYRSPNPRIDFAASPFYVNAELRPWISPDGPRRAGVSSFGVGGTNVHAVLQQAPAIAAAAPSRAHELLVLSARDPQALSQAREALAAHLQQNPEINLGDVAFTLQAGRRGFAHRWAAPVADVPAAIAALAASAPPRVAAEAPAIVFMFPGQGAQYPDMGRGLYDAVPVFRHAIDRCAEILQPHLDVDLRTLLYPPQADAESHRLLMATVAAQPAIFAVEYALAQLWLDWGIKPTAMIGHSVGEFVAACIAGVFSLEDVLGLVAARGRMMQALPGGAMLAVRLPEAELAALLGEAPLLGEDCAIAAVNAPSLCVAAGTYQAINTLEEILQARDVGCRRLHTSHAFHSPMMDPIVAPFTARVSAITLQAPHLPYVSCVTGGWATAEQTTSPAYWAEHFRAPVRFADGLASLAAPGQLLLEVGPGNALGMLARQGAARGATVLASLPDAARAQPDDIVALETLGQLWTHGFTPDWRAVHAPATRRRIPLPTYRFQRVRHWVDAPAGPAATLQPSTEISAKVQSMPADIISAPPTRDAVSGDRHHQAIRAGLIDILETLSGDDVGSADPATTFLELGFDSLFLSQVTQQLQSRYGVKITFRQLLGEYATLELLTGYVASQVAPAPVVAEPPPVMAVLPAAVPAPVPVFASPVAATPIGTGVEAVMQAQLQAMSELMARQLEALRGVPAAAPATPAPVLAAASVPVPVAPIAAPAEPEASATPSRFQVYTPRQKSADGLTPEQRRHIDALTERYTSRTATSKRQTQQHRRVLADPRAASGFRAEWKEMVYPIVCTRAAGSKIWDADGNEYIDLVNGYGQTAFGHSPDFVVDAVSAQLRDGFAIGPQTPLAGEVAELFCELTGNERVTFCNTGSEAVMAAMRLSRAVTGRNRVVMFTGAYHGQFDEVLVKGISRRGTHRSMPVAPGIPPEAVANLTVLDYATPESLAWVREHADELAAVIVETVQSRHPALRPKEFLQALRDITTQSGTALIFDEVVTGFRMHPGGMQAVFGIRADLATYGKVVGGGLPIGILAGTARFMDALDGGQWQYGDDSIPEVGVTFFAGTFVRHPLVMAATLAVLKYLREAGPALYERLEQRAQGLVARLDATLAAAGLKTRVESYGSLFYFSLAAEAPLGSLLYYHMRARGIHIQEGFPCFLTTEHSDADLDLIATVFADSIAEMQAAGVLPGSPAPGGGERVPASLADVRPTEPQTEIWLAAQLGDDASCAFNESVSLRLAGPLDVAALTGALNACIARHDALRTFFGITGDRLHIAPPVTLELAAEDLTSARDAEQALQQVVADDAATPFDLVAGPPLRARLLRLAPDQHVLVFTAHHIVCDGWSINLVMSEIAESYAARVNGVPATLPAVLPFSHYADAQAKRDPAEFARVETFWLDRFSQVPAPLDLPSDRPRPMEKSFRGATATMQTDAAAAKAIKRAGGQAGATLFTMLLAAVQVLVGRLADHRDVVVAVPTAGQSLEEGGSLVGHCVNFLPIRGTWQPETGFKAFLTGLQKTVLEAFEHQTYTFGTLVRRLALPRDPSRMPLTSVQFNLERLGDRLPFPGLQATLEPNGKRFVNFDLFFNVIESDAGLRVDCEYSSDLFDAATIDRWLSHLQCLLAGCVADMARPIATLPLLTPDEHAHLLAGLNRTDAPLHAAALVQAAFERQAALTPDAVAVSFGANQLSYAQLDARANRLAHHLVARVTDRQARIGLLIERSEMLLVALLAVLKSGLAYVPLDPHFPSARLRAIAAEADLAMLVTQTAPDAELAALAPHVLVLDAEQATVDLAPAAAPALAAQPDRLAYVIYTSGSTGTPKGVEVTHRGVVNLLAAMTHEPGIAASDVLLAVTTIAFDIAVLELLLPLGVGAQVAIAPRDVTLDGHMLRAELERVGATMMQATPATWSMLLQAGFVPGPRLRMLCGGEALPAELAQRLLAGGGALWNMYGPTETTIWSAATRVHADAPLTLGAPIANTGFYVVDSALQPLPLGVPGELCISGAGVARGYFRQPERSAAQFVANALDGRSSTLYRTGDVAKRLPDGTLQLLGRSDQQVKLRGFRIELGEIETLLDRLPGIAACAVALKRDAAGHARLVAYFTEESGSTVQPAELRAALAAQLPDYMVPTGWVRLERMPATPNGKLDRRALPDTDWIAADTRAAFVAPRGELETTLAAIFADVLQFSRVGIDDDLIVLGADSIHLFQITARANAAGIRLAAKDLMQHRSIARLAAALGEALAPAHAPPGHPTLALRDAAKLRAGRTARISTPTASPS